jgi:hypothetical protein
MSGGQGSGWWRRRRRQRRDEPYIERYVFPEHIEGRCRGHHPDLSGEDWKLVEQGLREWFLCCAWRDGEVLGLPSRLVDDAWHEFILDSKAYTQFCEEAFGGYLHHTPEPAMSTPMGDALGQTVQAWDRSDAGRQGESVLWGLDRLIGVAAGLGLAVKEVAAARAEGHEHGAAGWAGGGEGGHHHGSSSGEAVSSGGGGEGGSGGDTGGGGDSGSGGGGGCGGGN